MSEKLNFSEIMTLVVDNDRYSSGIIGQILRGFGVAHQANVGSIEAAKKQLETGAYHLLITESVFPDGNLDDFIGWIRSSSKKELRCLPIVLLTGYAFFTQVASARDCGVNSVVRKPVSPVTLFDHIAWSARGERPFIDADAYIGPCRRFRFGDPAPGLNRRVSDHPDAIPAAAKTPAPGSMVAG